MGGGGGGKRERGRFWIETEGKPGWQVLLVSEEEISCLGTTATLPGDMQPSLASEGKLPREPCQLYKHQPTRKCK